MTPPPISTLRPPARKAYSMDPFSQSTSRREENGYDSGIIMPPSTSADRPSLIVDEDLDLVEAAGTRIAFTAGGDRQRCAEDPIQCVVVVDHHVDDGAAREIGAAEQRRPGGKRLPARGKRRARRAQLTAGHLPRDLDVLGPEAEDVSHHEDAVGFGREALQCPRIVERESDWLLQQDVFARRERGLRRRPVLRRGEADVDGVDVRVGDDLREVVRPARADLARPAAGRDRDSGA